MAASPTGRASAWGMAALLLALAMPWPAEAQAPPRAPAQRPSDIAPLRPEPGDIWSDVRGWDRPRRPLPSRRSAVAPAEDNSQPPVTPRTRRAAPARPEATATPGQSEAAEAATPRSPRRRTRPAAEPAQP